MECAVSPAGAVIQLGIMFLDAGMDESHHHGKGEVALGLHPVQTTDVVVLEA